MRLAAIALLALSSCAHAPPPASSTGPSPAVDSLTTALWRMDAVLTEDRVADDGPHALHGTTGPDVGTDLGYQGRCKVFSGSSDSFVYVPHSAIFDSLGTMVIDAWVQSEAGTPQGFNTIAARWSPRPDLQSWILFLANPGGEQTVWPPSLSLSRDRGRLYFALQSDTSPVPSIFVANGLGEWRDAAWNHVAVSIDGSRVTFYLNDRLDSSFPCFGRIRASRAPLTIGNLFDISYDMGATVIYRGLDGAGFKRMIDEVRLSRVAR